VTCGFYDNQMETTIGLMEFALKATIIGVRLTKK
jgi:hypothetical protein